MTTTTPGAPAVENTGPARIDEMRERLRALAASRTSGLRRADPEGPVPDSGDGFVDRVVRIASRGWSVVTPFGRTILLLGFVSWLVGWLLGWYEFMVMAAAFGVVLLIAIPFTFGRALLDVTLQVTPTRVTVGERAAGLLAVRNAARTRLLPNRLELAVGNGVARFDVPSLGVDESHEEIFVVPTRRRSVIAVGPASTIKGDPLGLLRREVPWSGVEELIVHPRIARLETLGTGFLRDLEGQTTNHLSSSDVAFHTLRDYVPGDDRRYVHWKTTARTGKLMVRQFVDTRRSHAAVVVDCDPASYADPTDPESGLIEEFELAVSAAGSLAVRVLRDEQTLTLITPDGRQPSGSGQQALDSCSRMELVAGRGLPLTASALANDAADASIVFLITGSRSTLGDLRKALVKMSPDATVLAVRARLGANGGFREAAGLTVGEIGAPEHLARLLRAAVR